VAVNKIDLAFVLFWDYSMGQYPSDRFQARFNMSAWRLGGSFFGVAAINPYRGAPGRLARFDIPPPIPDEITRAQIQPILGRSLQKQARFGLPAEAGIPVIVIANEEIVDRERHPERLVDAFHYGALLGSARHIRLVGHDQQKKSLGFQCSQGFRHVRQDFQFVHTGRRVWLPLADNGAIQDSVAIEKNGPQRADSHLVSARLISG
jgi:hypothetical protein